MFEELLFIMGFLLFSFLISYVLFTYTPSPLNKIVKALAIIGIIFHEVCHLLMCIITGARIEKINLLDRAENKDKESKIKYGKYQYFGSIKIRENRKLTFLQAVLISLAPLVLSFWLFFYLWELILDPQINIFLFFFAVFIMVSIVLAAAPSLADVICIPSAFKQDPHYSLYQIFLSALSIITVWILVNKYQLSFIHEAITYALIMLLYYVFKYAFRGISLIYTNRSGNNSLGDRKLNYKRYTRRRFKPTKPRKLGKEEAHW